MSARGWDLTDFRRACDDMADVQRRALSSLFSKNNQAAHLRKHGVLVPDDGGFDAEEALRVLPLTTYADYQPMILAALQACSELFAPNFPLHPPQAANEAPKLATPTRLCPTASSARAPYCSRALVQPNCANSMPSK
jgi:hypothetical protein